ncbi:PREDICTED: uncharacterized protein LOC18589112 [Theobroma cacao]|uniref:Uncharacterized protein LOC18589112 n=1 Tax=Theobroma cacao TaxID=3641 RepID=A0AB32UQP5_THECC|nr:PREDICTED: uncharacterized protein LOC18589112 [Theobroma cacao]
MENFIPLIFDLLTLLADTYKIYLKNGRLMGFIAALVISLHTVLYLLNVFSVKSLITDLIAKQSHLIPTTPGTPEFTNLLIGTQKDIKIYAGVEWIFLLIIAVASLFLAISTTHASALIHGGKKISIKDLVLRAVRSLKRPFVTCFYITLFGLGYIFLCLVTLLPLVLILGSEVTSSVFAIPLFISAMVFYSYLSVVWNLSLVISVLEETFGIEALGKAAQIVKGMKLQGFILNLLLTILPLLLSQCLRLITLKQSEAIRVVITLLLLNSIWLARMFGHTAYTVLYYQCKKTHGEEVELQADMEYTKIPTAPLINENIL